MEHMDYIVQEVKKLMASTEVFLKSISDRYEDLDTKIAFEYYKAAYQKTDRFESYRTYDPELLLLWGITDSVETAYKWGDEPSLIPDSLRPIVLVNQRKHVIDTYVEKNEYIRTRLGLPSLEEMENEEFIYASDEFYNEYNIERKPLHELSNLDVARLENYGEYKKILNEYSDKKYLRYIGDHKLDLFAMKTASNFQLLRVDETLDRKMLSDFTFLYEQCRTYVVNVTYVKDFSNKYEHYDGYMGMLILTMAIQRLIVEVFRVSIDRDFYDIYNLQALFESYNIPFIKDLPLDYQRVLARNLNRLLRYKSSDRVLYDVAEILGFNSAEFYKYFLVKQHKYDRGEPVFITETKTDEDGNEYEVYNYEQMYDIYFQGINMKEENESIALTDVSNIMSYDDMVHDDEYWWDDDGELRKVLYESEYNVIESKYIGVHVMYRLTEMVHEAARFFRMIIDRKEETDNIFISLPKVKSEGQVTFFEAIIMAICLICKRNKMRGEIISTPSKTLSVIGFNFRADFDMIREFIDANKDLIDHETITRLIMDYKMDSVDDINRLYGNIKELWEFLVDKMSRSQNLHEYNAYEKLYKALIYTDDLSTIFTMSNGEIAKTYFEYLADLNEGLAVTVEKATEQDVLILLEHIIYSLEDEISNLEYLEILTEGNDIMINALRTLIMFFKSYTVDLKHLSIIYVLDNRYYNMIKLISHIKSLEADITVGSSMDRFIDRIHILGEILAKDDMKLLIKTEYEAELLVKALAKLKDKISSINSSITISSRVNIDSDIGIDAIIFGSDRLKIEDSLTYSSAIHGNAIAMKDDELTSLESKIYLSSILDITDYSDVSSTIELKDNVQFNTESKIYSLIDVDEVLDFKDRFETKSEVTVSDKVSLTDLEELFSDVTLEEYAKMSSIISSAKEMNVSTDIVSVNVVDLDVKMTSSMIMGIIDDVLTESNITLQSALNIYEKIGYSKDYIIGSIMKLKNKNITDISNMASDIMEIDDDIHFNSERTISSKGNLLSKHELLIIREG